jgi:predicted nucleotidyltransferase
MDSEEWEDRKMNPSPTPYPDVNAIVFHLFTKVKAVLQEQHVGMYIHGSLANGGFDEASDIDVIFVTKEDLNEETCSKLSSMHTELSKMDSPWAVQLEVAYIPQRAFVRFDPSILYPHLDRGGGEVLHKIAPESDWAILCYILRERGITIWGPNPKTFINPVPPNDLRLAVAAGMPIWFSPIIVNPSEINKRGYQSFFVLSTCRMLYTLKYCEILSKHAAAKWGLENLDRKWHPLIEHALAGRQGSNIDADMEDINSTIEMMKYALQQIKPTPYPDVNEVLRLLHANAKTILGNQFVGMYLYGSLSSGDFNPETSDIDFLLVTDGVLSEKAIAELEVMHQQTWATSLKRAGELEGAYIPKELIRKHDPDGLRCPTVNEGKFYLDRPGSDWIIQRHVVREYGVVIEGPDPKILIDFVTPDDIHDSVMGILNEWWFPMLDDPSWLRDHDNAYRAFAVITMCRVLHALEHGTVVSKPKAVQWARAKVGDNWKMLIDKSVVVSNHEEQDILLDETLDFIRFIKDQT